MKEIKKYKITWRPEDNGGMVHFELKGDGAASINLDSAAEAAFLLDLLRNEKPVFFDAEHGLIASGFEAVGEGES